MMNNGHIDKLEDLQKRFNEQFPWMTNKQKREFTNRIFKIAIQRERGYLAAEEIAESVLERAKEESAE